MILEFTDSMPGAYRSEPVLISGPESKGYSNLIFLTLTEGHAITRVFEIKFDVHCSPFREALLIDSILAVGHEQYFYLFDITTHQNILRWAVSGYFGHLYYDHALFYVADANGLHCIDTNGEIRWCNRQLANDGVIVNEFTDQKISGSGDFDPPGGWKDFILDKATGIKIK